MNGKFIDGKSAERDTLDWGRMGWFSRPATTGASQLVSMEVELQPGFGHDFHKHPEQEEVIYVIEGMIEQWLEEERQMLEAGDAIFISPDIVHASFNTSNTPAKLLVSLSPCVGEEGYQLVDVSDQEPWRSLRNTQPT